MGLEIGIRLAPCPIYSGGVSLVRVFLITPSIFLMNKFADFSFFSYIAALFTSSPNRCSFPDTTPLPDPIFYRQSPITKSRNRTILNPDPLIPRSRTITINPTPNLNNELELWGSFIITDS